MKNKKTMSVLVVGAIFALLLNFYPQHTSLAEDNPSGSGNDCSWGFASVEKSWLSWRKNVFTKFCDCTAVRFMVGGNHTPCTPIII